MAKVVHVHLLVGKHEGRKDFYFSSISAVYTVLTAEEVGATKGYLLHAGLGGNGTVCTKRAIIKQSTLISGGRMGDVSAEEECGLRTQFSGCSDGVRMML